MFDKPKTFRSEQYLEFVRSLSCYVCGYTQGIEPHHAVTGGMGIKGSDLHAIPLCKLHHLEYHQFGKETFWERHNLDKWKVISEIMGRYIKEKEKNGK